MPVGILTLHLRLPGCTSLKEKRSRIKPLVIRLHREFNVSAAEMDHLDSWQEASVACALVSNDPAQCQRSLQSVVAWVEREWQDVQVEDDYLELL